MNILLACNAGVSTGMLADKMEKKAKAQGLECRVWAVDDGQVEGELASGGVDIVLIGPQIKYKLKDLQKRLGHYGVPIVSMNPIDYGMNNADNILRFAQEQIEKR